jgi:hypothetical protein
VAEIKAIETRYKGYRFRSRLEARWAVFFDALGIEWEYEKEGYQLPSGLYLPDFWLPHIAARCMDEKDQGIWFEIKGVEPTDLESNLCSELAEHTETDVILAIGMPRSSEQGDHMQQFFKDGESWDNYMVFMKCHNRKCGAIKIEFMESNYSFCSFCNSRADETHPLIAKAEIAAKSARFEHGERP